MDIFEKCVRATEYESGLKESGYYFFFGSSNLLRILR